MVTVKIKHYFYMNIMKVLSLFNSVKETTLTYLI